jgi:hypothetical protein
MKRGIAIFLGVLMALLGLSDVGQAQSHAMVQVQGTIRVVDCQAYTVTLDTAGGTVVYRAAASAAIIVNSAGVPLCALQQYPGAAANVWVTAIQSELVITRIDAVGQGYAPPPPQTAPYAPAPYPYQTPVPYSYPAPYPAYYAPPLLGLVLGTIVVAGLVYLLVRQPSGVLYRYPYYGPYYRHYYQPIYRPYYGPLRYAPAYNYGSYRWCPPARGYGYWCR